jgi:hypothetical protein
MSTTHATVVPGTPIYQRPRTGSSLSNEQLALLKTKIIALRKLSDISGFSTNKSIVDLLNPLSQHDLILLGTMMLEPSEDRGNR